MKVKDLIAILETKPPEAHVDVLHSYDGLNGISSIFTDAQPEDIVDSEVSKGVVTAIQIGSEENV